MGDFDQFKKNCIRLTALRTRHPFALIHLVAISALLTCYIQPAFAQEPQFASGFEACEIEISGYPDSDSDGFGDDSAKPSLFCYVLGEGFVENMLDCNDTTSSVAPGQPELCDTLDNDCLAKSGDGEGEPWFNNECDGDDADMCAEGFYFCDAGNQACNDFTGDNVEFCNAADDDCDGVVDDGFECASGSGEACATICESTGSRTCSGSCTWGECIPPPETCNALDDDCDGQADNGFECTSGAGGSCTTVCGSTGSRTCSGACSWGECNPPVEVCNGQDDDCDSVTDNGFQCPQGVTEECVSTCGTTGTRMCSGSCSWGACNPPAEVCNGIDDDCDAVIPLAELDGDGDDWVACDIDAGGWLGDPGVLGGLDCDNSDPTVYPGALEICNGVDDDCDGMVDEDCTSPLGGSCDMTKQCADGLVCVDGVCCSTTCEGNCEACDLLSQEGTCSPIPAGEDPAQECGEVSCSAYFWGWSDNTCYRQAPAPGNCDGARSCESAATACLLAGQGSADLSCEEGYTPNQDSCSGTTAPICEPIPGSISGTVWLDQNGDGMRQGGVDIGLSGVSVELFADGDQDGLPDGPALTNTMTDGSGAYLLEDVLGHYVLQATYLSGFCLSSGPDSSGDSATGYTFTTSVGPDEFVSGVDMGVTDNGCP